MTLQAKGRVLVTGASGFVGQALCRHLRDRGWQVRAALRRRDVTLPEEIESCQCGDLASADWRTCLEEVDAVVHCAALVHRPDGEAEAGRFHAVNVTGSARLAEAAAAAGVRRFVHLSSQVVAYGPDGPSTAYRDSKQTAETALQAIARTRGLELVILRPPLVYGPGAGGNFARLAKAVGRGWPLPLASLKRPRSFLFLGNLVDAVACCLEHPEAPGQIFPVSDDGQLTVGEFARQIGLALGRPARLWPCPAALLRLLGGLLGRGDSLRSLTAGLVADNAALAARLGWRPAYSLQDGLKQSLTPAEPAAG